MKHFIYNSPEFRTHLKKSSHVKGEVKFLQSITRMGMKVMEVGANTGVTTVTIAKKIGTKGKLYSFEPVPEYFTTVKKNLSLNRVKNVKIFRLVASNKVKIVDFYKDGGSSSIVRKKGIKKFKVSAITVDMFLKQERVKKIDLLNMDCEGSELLVLKGAKETLQRSKVRIFCEIHHDLLKRLGQSVQDIVRYLKRLNFRVQNVSLDNLSLENKFKGCEYIYAHK